MAGPWEDFAPINEHGPWEDFARSADQSVPGQISLPLIGKPSLIGMAKGLFEEAKSAATLPGDVYAGRVNPESDEGIKRSLGAASIISPASVGRTMALRPAAPAPTAAVVKDAATVGYKELTQEAAAIPIAKAAGEELASNLKTTLNAEGLRPSVAPKVHSTLDEVAKAVSERPDLGELIALKKSFKEIAGGIDKSERKAAMMVLPELDAKIVSLAPEILPKLKTADANYASAMQAATIEKAISKARDQASKSGMGGNLDNAIRQRISSAVEKSAGLTPQEMAQARRVVQGGAVTNIARGVGKFDPTSHGLAALIHLGATLPTMGMNLPFAVAGMVGRRAAEARTLKAAKELSRMIRDRSPLAQNQDRGGILGLSRLPPPNLSLLSHLVP